MYSSPGGMAGTLWKGSSLGVSPSFSGTLSSIGNGVQFSDTGVVSITGNITIGGSSALIFSGRSKIFGLVDGTILLQNNAATDFTRLQFGGTSNSFPALDKSGSGLRCVLADGSAFTQFTALTFIAASAATSSGATNLQIGNGTASTVGAAGAAAALPASPLGYLVFNLNNTAIKVPYYNN